MPKDKKKDNKKNTVGKNRKSGLGLNFKFDTDLMPDRSTPEDMMLAPFNPQAGQRFIDQNDTIRQTDDYFRTLDHEEAVVYKNGYVMAACKGNKGSVSLSKRFVETAKGEVIGHYHPSGDTKTTEGFNGGPLSFVDINLPLSTGCREISATADEGKYRLIVTDKSDVQGFINDVKGHSKDLQRKINATQKRTERVWRKGVFKKKQEARAYGMNKSFEQIDEYYKKYAKKHGLIYTIEKSDEGLKQERYNGIIKAQYDYMKDKQRVKNSQKYDRKPTWREKKDMKKGNYQKTVIYADNQSTIIGYANGKNVGGIYTIDNTHGFFKGIVKKFRIMMM